MDEWQCANDSGTGFRQVMNAHGINSAFNFFGTNAWERDFKKGSLGGTDSTYVDNVDAVLYTGHGGPNGFSFKDTAHDDGGIGPSDADWGNGDLEWLNLESCQVLRDTNGNMDQLTRWGGTVNGLHMINGYHTNARCVDGGTGRTIRPAPARRLDLSGGARPQRLGDHGDHEAALRPCATARSATSAPAA